MRHVLGWIIMTTLVLAIAGSAAAGDPVGEGVWVNYDFVTGPRILYYEDFTRDEVGNFPQRLEFVKGNMEVADWQGRRWLRASGGRSEFNIILPETLPERFTLEIEYFGDVNSNPLELRFTDDNKAPNIFFAAHRSGIGGGVPRVDAWARTTRGSELRKEVFHCRVRADGDYVKVYTNEERTANTPKAPLGRTKKINVRIPAVSAPTLLTNIRIASGGRKIYDELIEKGRVITRGILFDVDSFKLRGESTPALREICSTLKEHAEITVLEIEGHTDDSGDEAANLELSQKRAEAVTAYLVSNCGIESKRLVARGYGESKPVAPNKSVEDRQRNRRVELAIPKKEK